MRGLATVLICTNRCLVSADENRVALLWKDYRIDGPDRWRGDGAAFGRKRQQPALAP